MDASTVYVIALAEALLVSILVGGVLLVQLSKLRKAHDALVVQLKDARLEIARGSHLTSYSQGIDQQLSVTRARHQSIGEGGDIALDLDPDAPPERRCMALRHAWLIAEKEAIAKDEQQVDWQLLMRRYEQLLAFEKDYRPGGSRAVAAGSQLS